MPTGHCNFPDHHGPSAGRPLGLLAVIAIGAIVVANWHTVVVVLAVVLAISALGVVVMLLVHSHRAEPYDAAYGTLQTSREAVLGTGDRHAEGTARVVAAWDQPELPEPANTRTAALEAEVAELRKAINAGGGQHLHLHGVSAEDVAAIVANRKAIEGS